MTEIVISILRDLIYHCSVGYQTDKNSHKSLCYLGAHWLVRHHKCRVVLVERGGGHSEMPDVIGWIGPYSYLLEAKTSRTDFLKDCEKSFRENPEEGVGQYRYYIYPKGLIEPGELPKGWGGLYVTPKGIIKKAKECTVFKEYNKDAEFMMMSSALASPWKLFDQWHDNQIQRLAGVRWMSKTMESDIRLMCAKLAALRIKGE